MSKIVIKQDLGLSDLIYIPVKTWITMLAIGAVGHRLGIPYLFRFGFWDVFLVGVALSVVKTSYVNQWKIEWDEININMFSNKEKK